MTAENRVFFSSPLRASRRATLRGVLIFLAWITFASLFAADLWRSGPKAGPAAAGAPFAVPRDVA